jgi:hypothetical protein
MKILRVIGFLGFSGIFRVIRTDSCAMVSNWCYWEI